MRKAILTLAALVVAAVVWQVWLSPTNASLTAAETGVISSKRPLQLKPIDALSSDDKAERRKNRDLADLGKVPPGLTVPEHQRNGCEWYDYTCGTGYYWQIPDSYGDDFFNMRFSPPDPGAMCTLKTLEIVFYELGTVDSTGAGVTLYVWDDDGFGFPLNVQYSVSVPSASIPFYPSALDVDVYSQNLVFSDDYHFGYTTNDQDSGNI